MRPKLTRHALRYAAVGTIAVVALACQATTPTPPRVVWIDRVPTPAPAAVAAQPVVARGVNTLALLPISPTGAQIGVEYGYEMPHCGVRSPIDVDGSFWDPVDVLPDPVVFDGQLGTFTLVSITEATFSATSGGVLHLVRHAGAKEFFYCQ
jgi:hypothetical protein